MLRWPHDQISGRASGAADERVVRRHGAVARDPHHLPQMAAEVLRRCLLLPLAEPDIERAVAAEHQAGAEVAVAGDLRRLAEDHRDVVEPRRATVAHKAAAGDRGAGTALARLGVGEIDALAVGEIGVEGDVEEAALAARRDRRHTGDGVRKAAVLDEPQPARPLGDEHRPVRQEGEAPGMVEAAHHLLEHRRMAIRRDDLGHRRGRYEHGGGQGGERAEGGHVGSSADKRSPQGST